MWSLRPIRITLMPGILFLASCAKDTPVGPEASIATFQSSATVTGTDLGTLGGLSSYAQAINRLGTVVGYSNTLSGDVHAFRWSAGEGMVDLGTLPGDAASAAVSVLHSGTILGWSQSAGGTITPVGWEADGSIHRLNMPQLPDAATGMVPTDFNERGQVIGYDITLSGMQRGWYWSNRRGTVEIPGGGETYPSAINAHGAVVGGYGDLRAFLWSRGGILTDLGISGGQDPNSRLTALSLNELGRVVGWIQLPDFTSAYVWSSKDGFTLLTGGTYAYATGINKHGLIVGAAAGVIPNGPIQAVAWPATNSMLRLSGDSPHAGVATAVNDRGQAVGWIGVDDSNTGTNHAMLWVISPARHHLADEAPAVAEATPQQAPVLPLANTPNSCLSVPSAIASKGALTRCILARM